MTTSKASANLTNFSAVRSKDGSKVELWLTRPDQKLMETLSLRPAAQEHRNFIIATWVQSYKSLARKQGINSKVYEAEEPKLAENFWQNCIVLTPDDGDSFTIHGWVCGVHKTLLQCYVPPELRRIGIASCLIEATCGKQVVIPRPWPFQKPPRGFEFIYNPYAWGTLWTT